MVGERGNTGDANQLIAGINRNSVRLGTCVIENSSIEQPDLGDGAVEIKRLDRV